MMTDDRELCVCFHVPRQKIIKFIRIHQPEFTSQVSECYGAGTGCGYCIPFIREIHETMSEGREVPDDGMSLDEYLARRKEYHRQKKIIDRGEVVPELVLEKQDPEERSKYSPGPVDSLTDDIQLKDSLLEEDE